MQRFKVVLCALLSLLILGCDARKQERDALYNELQGLGGVYQEIRVIREPGDLFTLVNDGYVLTTDEYENLKQILVNRFGIEEGEFVLQMSETCWPEDPDYWPTDLDPEFLWPNGRPNKVRPEAP